MSLPEPWVDRIFTKLTLTYGEAFMRMYGGLDVADVKANWAHELACFQQNAEAIRFGLENLPEKPPNVVQFRDACRRMPRNDLLKLPLPEPAPEMAAKVREVFASATQRASDKAWAYALQAREQRGETLSYVQRTAWREALRTWQS